MKTIEYIKSLELETGGLAAWAGEKAYPECTGYLIPTLLSYGEQELAERLGDWLESIQNKDGSFDGLDGIPRAFDTGAAIEGLRALGRDTSKAEKWMKSQMIGNRLRIHPNTEETHIYNLRPLAIIGKKLPFIPELPPTRSHYMAYALEGLHNMSLDIGDYLKPYAKGKTLLKFDDGGGSDTCATAQIAVLCLKNGIECDGLVEAVREMVQPDGGVWHGSGDKRACLWTMKYYLDMEKLLEGNKVADKRAKGRVQGSKGVPDR